MFGPIYIRRCTGEFPRSSSLPTVGIVRWLGVKMVLHLVFTWLYTIPSEFVHLFALPFSRLRAGRMLWAMIVYV